MNRMNQINKLDINYHYNNFSRFKYEYFKYIHVCFMANCIIFILKVNLIIFELIIQIY
jgi:hypothetical protein